MRVICENCLEYKGHYLDFYQLEEFDYGEIDLRCLYCMTCLMYVNFTRTDEWL